MAPVDDARHHDRVHLGDNVIHGCRAGGWIGGTACGDVSGAHGRNDRALLDGGAVVGNPVRNAMQMRAERFGRQVAHVR